MNSTKNQYTKRNTQAESAYSDQESKAKSSPSYTDMAKDVGKQSLKIVAYLFFVAILFVMINVAFIVHNVFHINNSVFGYISVILSFIATIVFVFLALSTTYRFAIVNLIGLVYKYLTPFFKRICVKIIDGVVNTGNKLSGKDINNSLNIGAIMLEIYGKKAPKYIQKGLVFIINRIPFSDFLKEMHKDLSEKKDPVILSEILYKHLHCYLTRIFQNNSIKKVFLIFGLNLLIQILVIYCLH